MGSSLSHNLYPDENVEDQESVNSSLDMDGGELWDPDPVEEVMGASPSVSHVMDSMQSDNAIDDQTTERGDSLIMDRVPTESMKVNGRQVGSIDATGNAYQQSHVMVSSDNLSTEVFDAHQLSMSRMIQTPEHDNIDVNQCYEPCDESFDLSHLYAQTYLKENLENVPEHESKTSRPEKEDSSYSGESEGIPALQLGSCADMLGSEEIDRPLEFENCEYVQFPKIDKIVQEKNGQDHDLNVEGGQNLQVTVSEDTDWTKDVMFNEASANDGYEIGSTLNATSIKPHQPNLNMDLVQTNLTSPEETANVIMDEMLKRIFNAEKLQEDVDVGNIIENPENNFVNVSQFVITESIPLKFDLVTGEMVPEMQAVSDKGGTKELVARDKSMPSKSVAKVKPNSIGACRNIAKVKPLPQSTPLQLMTILSASATPSSFTRQSSSRKCSCLKHSVLGYPPSSVLYWQVRTTPSIRKTIMDFDNEGVKFLYDDGCLKAFETVLKSFKPEFLAAEKSLEVSLCLSCVQWAEGEAKERKRSIDASDSDTESAVSSRSRKRGRPINPGGTKKAKKELLDNENVYQKKYTSRSRRTNFTPDKDNMEDKTQHTDQENNEDTKEESKSAKMLMYDLYCDMPGCNARLRGYPSLVKHFKAKHPDEATTPEEAGVKDQECSENEDIFSEVSSKSLTVNNDPFMKLKAEEDMKLLYVKIEKLPSSICLTDKVRGTINSGQIKERRKSVGFKEGEKLVTIREISPRRPYETRNRGKYEVETIDLRSPPRNNNVRRLLSPKSNHYHVEVPYTKVQTQREDLEVDKNQNEMNKFEMAPETLIPVRKSNSALPTELESNFESNIPQQSNQPTRIEPRILLSDLPKLENKASLSKFEKLRVSLVPAEVSPMQDLESNEQVKMSKVNGQEEQQIRSESENQFSIRNSGVEKNQVNNVENDKTQSELKSSSGLTPNSQSTITKPRKSERTKSILKPDLIILENVAQSSDLSLNTESAESISKKTQNSISEQTGNTRKRQHDTELFNSGPDAKASRSGKVTDQSPHCSNLKNVNKSEDLDKLFADIDGGILTIQIAAKNKGLQYAKMYHLYRVYKMNKLKNYCEKIKASNKIKEKYSNSYKLSNTLKKDPLNISKNKPEEVPSFSTDNVEHVQEAVNVEEPSKEAFNIGLKTLQDRTKGIQNLKQELSNHLSLAEPLSKDDKQCLLEVVGVINEALLKDP